MQPNAIDSSQSAFRLPDLASRAPFWLLSSLGAMLWWVSQPPLGMSFVAWVAAIPWLMITRRKSISLREWFTHFAITAVYWLVTMQGIRHAHPAMYGALVAFAIYLSLYSLLFVILLRRVAIKNDSPLPFWLAVPIVGTGLECIRNYLLTGVSATMIGHSQVNHPHVIQIADAFGTYGVTFLVLLVNAAIYESLSELRRRRERRWRPLAVGLSALIVSLGYGAWRLREADISASQNASEVNIALIGRDEEIVFVQDSKRELEIFDGYFRQSMEAARGIAKAGGKLDAVVWPESMYNGSLPWLLVDEPDDQSARLPLPKQDQELLAIIAENREQFQRRSAQVQAAIRQAAGQKSDPHLIVGCSVIRYRDPPQVHSGIVHIGERGKVIDWYGKTHLVMFGEYIPLIDYLPFVSRWVPPGMGVERGSGPMAMAVGDLKVSPNICIETAVERVTPNHVIDLIARGEAPDAIVNVTNDGWFDRSSIVEHHLRCSQLVAVTCRRPVLISANGGPTAWIDGSGRIVQRLANDEAGSIIANVVTDGRWGLYQWIHDWPARFTAVFCVWILLSAGVSRWKDYRLRRKKVARHSADEGTVLLTPKSTA